jgi:hypothetical protein
MVPARGCQRGQRIMLEPRYDYIVIGAGLAGASAVEGIREVDSSGSVLLIGSEPQLPYNRPPLSKGLWSGKDKLEAVWIHDADFYQQHHVALALGTTVTAIDAARHTVEDSADRTIGFGKLLLATVQADSARRGDIIELVGIFEGTIVDVGHDQLTVMLAGAPSKIDDFEDLVRAYGIVELQRTGRVALPKLEKQAPRLRSVKGKVG